MEHLVSGLTLAALVVCAVLLRRNRRMLTILSLTGVLFEVDGVATGLLGNGAGVVRRT